MQHGCDENVLQLQLEDRQAPYQIYMLIDLKMSWLPGAFNLNGQAASLQRTSEAVTCELPRAFNLKGQTASLRRTSESHMDLLPFLDHNRPAAATHSACTCIFSGWMVVILAAYLPDMLHETWGSNSGSN